MSAGRSAVVERVNQSGILPLRVLQHMKGFRIPLTALFSLAAILLLFHGAGLKRNLGATALLKCGLLAGNPAPASSCHSLDPRPASAPPLLRGVLAYRFEDYRAALSLFELAQAEQPSGPVALFWIASAAYRSGDTPRAVLSWKTLGPRKMALFFRTRSQEGLESGDIAAALEWAKIAVEIDPVCGEAVLQLAQVYFQQGDSYEASGAFRKALRLKISPNERGAAYHALGGIDRSLGREQQALGEYRLAVEYAPLYSAPLHSATLYSAAEAYLFRRDLGDQLARLHHIPEARSQFDELLRLNPLDTSVLIRIGNLYLDQNQYAEAERWYQSALSVKPDSGVGEAALGRLYRQKGDLNRAADFFQKAIGLNPDNHWVSASLGGVYWQQGRLDQAIAAYRRVTGLSEDRLLLEDAWTSLARLYSVTGEKAEAQSAWESVLEINPANPAAQQALRKNP